MVLGPETDKKSSRAFGTAATLCDMMSFYRSTVTLKTCRVAPIIARQSPKPHLSRFGLNNG
jgi:hypothetical protein